VKEMDRKETGKPTKPVGAQNKKKSGEEDEGVKTKPQCNRLEFELKRFLKRETGQMWDIKKG